jgi:hypothetical protein
VGLKLARATSPPNVDETWGLGLPGRTPSHQHDQLVHCVAVQFWAMMGLSEAMDGPESPKPAISQAAPQARPLNKLVNPAGIIRAAISTGDAPGVNTLARRSLPVSLAGPYGHVAMWPV